MGWSDPSGMRSWNSRYSNTNRRPFSYWRPVAFRRRRIGSTTIFLCFSASSRFYLSTPRKTHIRRCASSTPPRQVQSGLESVRRWRTLSTAARKCEYLWITAVAGDIYIENLLRVFCIFSANEQLNACVERQTVAVVIPATLGPADQRLYSCRFQD